MDVKNKGKNISLLLSKINAKNMCPSCPRCNSTKIVKNGFTHHKKQNYKCKDCGRQFVKPTGFRKSENLKEGIKRALKERLVLRAICRIFKVSLSWLVKFALKQWQSLEENLGLTGPVIKKIKDLQVFGIQLDEMWSFVGKKEARQCNAGYG